MVNAPNTVQIWTTTVLQYLLITVKRIEFEKVTLHDMQNLKTVDTFTAYDKYSVLNREYLTQPIHMQLFQKQNTFSEFFSAFLKI